MRLASPLPISTSEVEESATKFVIYSSSSTGGSAEVLLEENDFATGSFCVVTFQLYAGQQYSVMYNGQRYSCEAKQIFDPEYSGFLVALGNTRDFDNNDTGEPFCIESMASGLRVIPLDGNAATVLLGISVPGAGSGRINQVLTVDKSGLQVDGHICATSGTLENLYINGKLYFNGETPGTYYIDGSAMSSPGGDAEQLMPAQWVNANMYFPTYVQLTVGELYDVQYNGTNYSCIAKQADQYPSYIFLGNFNMAFAAVDTGEPFCVVYDPSQSQIGVWCSEASVYFGISIKQCYINMPGFKVSTEQAYFSGELIAASGTFSGELRAASGTFSGRLQAGTAQYPFIISGGNTVQDSPCIYSMSPLYAGSGGFGSDQNNCVYIGGDGFSYWFNDNWHDYNTAIRPGYILCSGNNSFSEKKHKATVYTPGGIVFCYGGDTNLRTTNIPNNTRLAVGSMDISETNVLMGGNFTGRSSGSIVSDSTRKHDILTIDSQYDILFDALRPVTYKYNDGTSGRTHTGFIAQDVLSAIQLASLTTMDFAAYIEATDVDGSSVCGLRYEEFVSLNTWQIQKLKARVAELERIVATLQGV